LEGRGFANSKGGLVWKVFNSEKRGRWRKKTGERKDSAKALAQPLSEIHKKDGKEQKKRRRTPRWETTAIRKGIISVCHSLGHGVRSWKKGGALGSPVLSGGRRIGIEGEKKKREDVRGRGAEKKKKVQNVKDHMPLVVP